MADEVTTTKSPSVTIAIPTFNGKSWLQKSIPVILSQQYEGEIEILIVDSSSNDGTTEWLESLESITFKIISKAEFGHGKTRNFCISVAKGELILFTVQDAIPRDTMWVQNLVNALLSNKADAICGEQAAPKSPLNNPLQWFHPAVTSNATNVVSPTTFRASSPLEKLGHCKWDNVNALYRKFALEAVPFRDLRFGEDMAWAFDALNAGYSIGYSDSCKIWHYHHQTPSFTRNRIISSLYTQYKTFGVIHAKDQRPNAFNLLLIIGRLLRIAIRTSSSRPLLWVRYNWRLQYHTYNATCDFLQAMCDGDEKVDELHAELGRTSPVASAP